MSTKLVVLDLGLAQPVQDKSFGEMTTGGQILRLPISSALPGTILNKLHLPDGVAYSNKTKRLYVTCMGFPPVNDGSVISCRLDGSDPQVILAKGQIHTPKQLTLDWLNEKLYICDREGLRVHRCNLDGTELETLIQTGDWQDAADMQDQTNWCVGITVSSKFGLFYWSQKGPSKAGQGRIFCAPIEAVGKREPICLLDHLPEPVDLEIDEQTNTLFWTDRGELPYGNTFNRMQLDSSGTRPLATELDRTPGLPYRILAQHLHEPIGLTFDVKSSRWFVADMGGTIWSFDYNGGYKKIVYRNEYCAFSGILAIE